MKDTQKQTIQCPYCGQPNEILVDCSIMHQEYIEDCQVCCRPMTLNISIDENEALSVQVFSEIE